MAINIYREPDETSTPYLPMYFDVSSDEGTISSMISDVYVDDVLVSTIEKEPILGTTNTFRFDVGEIVKKHFTNEYSFQSGVTLTEATESAKGYHIRAFEVLDNGTTLDTSWSEDGAGTNYSQSNKLFAFDGLLHYEQNLSDYIFAANSKFGTNIEHLTSVFLANITNQQKVFRNVQLNFGFLTEETIKVRYVEYDSSMSVVSDNTTSTITPTNNKAIFTHDGAFDSSTTSIAIRILNSTGTVVSDILYFYVKEVCGENTTLYWKNSFGNYDTYTFLGNHKKKASSKQKTYSKRLNYNYSLGDRGELVRFSDNTEEFTLYTDTINEDTCDWLHEIYQSTDVFIYDGTNEIPIIVKGGQQLSTDNERPITQFSIRYVYANPKQSQIG